MRRGGGRERSGEGGVGEWPWLLADATGVSEERACAVAGRISFELDETWTPCDLSY